MADRLGLVTRAVGDSWYAPDGGDAQKHSRPIDQIGRCCLERDQFFIRRGYLTDQVRHILGERDPFLRFPSIWIIIEGIYGEVITRVDDFFLPHLGEIRSDHYKGTAPDGPDRSLG